MQSLHDSGQACTLAMQALLVVVSASSVNTFVTGIDAIAK
jgi:hypothetical protein